MDKACLTAQLVTAGGEDAMVKLDEATLTSQGQITIPKKVREKLHLEKGNRVIFWEDEKGHILLEEAEEPWTYTKEQWDEFLHRVERGPVTRCKGMKAAMAHLDKIIRDSKKKKK